MTLPEIATDCGYLKLTKLQLTSHASCLASFPHFSPRVGHTGRAVADAQRFVKKDRVQLRVMQDASGVEQP